MRYLEKKKGVEERETEEERGWTDVEILLRKKRRKSLQT